MSVYPLKSKYNWNVYESEVAHASKKVKIDDLSKPLVAHKANVSAMITFLKSPIENKNKPKAI